MVHITITSFHINLHANKSYLLDADPQKLYWHPRNSKSRKIHWVEAIWFTAVLHFRCLIIHGVTNLTKNLSQLACFDTNFLDNLAGCYF